MSMPAQKPPYMTKITSAYLAGFVDGEGCVRINRHKCGWTKLGYRFEPYLDITNTDKQQLLDIQRTLSAGTVRAKKMYHSNRKQGYVWTVYGNTASAILQKLLPFLRIKRRQAELLISYANTFCLDSRVGKRLSTKDRMKQLRIYTKVRKLNKRGTI